MAGPSHGCGTILERGIRAELGCGVLAGSQGIYSERTIPPSRFSLTTTNTTNCETCYAVFRLLLRRCCRSTVSSQWITHISVPFAPRALVQESRLAVAETKFEHGRPETVRTTTVNKSFRSQPEWIRVPVGAARYIPREYVLRVRGNLRGQ